MPPPARDRSPRRTSAPRAAARPLPPAAYLALVLLCALSAPTQAQPAAPAREPGSELEVYVMTMGQGDQIWERFGHNGLGIRDRNAGTNLVYNWGVFRFSEADFLPRFLRGEMRYSVEPYDADLTAAYYQSINRSVSVQELRLTPAQRVAIRDFVEWNAREENKYYRYDYFGDNCSTRVRDVVDKALGGALRSQFASRPSGRTFRDEARRLTEQDLLYTGIDIGLGSPSDREMTQWEAMFIPMRLRDDLREVRVAGPGGTTAPLVSSERVLISASRAGELAAPANHQLRDLLIGLAIAALIMALAQAAPAASRGAAATWCVVSGVLGVLLLGLWALTRHVWAYSNVNLLYFNPLWFVLAFMVARKVVPAANARRLAMLCAVLTVVGVVLGLLRWPQASEQVALLVLAPHAAVLTLLYKRKAT